MSVVDALSEIYDWCATPNGPPHLIEDSRCASIEYFQFSGGPVWSGLMFYRPPLSTTDQNHRFRQFRPERYEHPLFYEDAGALFAGWGRAKCNGQPCPAAPWITIEIQVNVDLLSEPPRVKEQPPPGPTLLRFFASDDTKPDGWPPEGNPSGLIWPNAGFPVSDASEERTPGMKDGESSTYVNRDTTYKMGRGELNFDDNHTLFYRLTTVGLGWFAD